jgi:hypothetical protein
VAISSNRVGIQVQLGQDLGGRQRMGDVGFAGEALLAQVGLGPELGGLPDAFNLLRRQVGFCLAEQLREAGGAPRAGTWNQAKQRLRNIHTGG